MKIQVSDYSDNDISDLVTTVDVCDFFLCLVLLSAFTFVVLCCVYMNKNKLWTIYFILLFDYRYIGINCHRNKLSTPSSNSSSKFQAESQISKFKGVDTSASAPACVWSLNLLFQLIVEFVLERVLVVQCRGY